MFEGARILVSNSISKVRRLKNKLQSRGGASNWAMVKVLTRFFYFNTKLAAMAML